jgi:Domain of unknown function (DUF6089)
MSGKLLTYILFSLLFGFAPQLSFAQKWEFGGGIGGAVYKGDLAPTFNPLYTRPGGTVFVKYNTTYATAWRMQATYTGLKANAAGIPNPYISTVHPNRFSTPLFEATGGLEYNFYDYRDPLHKRQRGTPYLYGGLGIFWFRPSGTENVAVSAIQPVIPFGFGYKYRLGKNLNFSAEFVARKTFTDYLDGVSNVDRRGWQHGFKFTNDWYAYLGINLSYTIYSILCPFDYNAP